jgi:hypothetical protein
MCTIPIMKWILLIAFALLVIPARAELTRDGALDMLIDASLYQTKCYGYVSPSAKAALNRLGDIFNIKLCNEIDAEKAVGRMAKKSLEIGRHPAALAWFCARAKLEIEEFDKLGQQN